MRGLQPTVHRPRRGCRSRVPGSACVPLILVDQNTRIIALPHNYPRSGTEWPKARVTCAWLMCRHVQHRDAHWYDKGHMRRRSHHQRLGRIVSYAKQLEAAAVMALCGLCRPAQQRMPPPWWCYHYRCRPCCERRLSSVTVCRDKNGTWGRLPCLLPATWRGERGDPSSTAVCCCFFISSMVRSVHCACHADAP